MICEKCGKEHDGNFGSGRFCSRSCASSCGSQGANGKTKIISCSSCGTNVIVDIRVSTKKFYCERCKKGTCSICGKVLSRNNKMGICSNCKNKTKKTNYQSVSDYKKRRKLFCIEYKGGKCEVCGYNKCVRALEFHHRDPTKKEFGIAKATIAIDKMKEELNKCILVCSNCHREIHDQLGIK